MAAMRTKNGMVRDSRPLGEYPYRALMIAVVQMAISDEGMGIVQEPCVRRWCQMADLEPSYLFGLARRRGRVEGVYEHSNVCTKETDRYGRREWV